MKKVFVPMFAASALLAGGYNIPEKSVNAVALSSAVVAHSSGVDSAYYNPANISFMSDGSQMELDLIYIGLSKVDYKGSVTTLLGTTNGVATSSEKEDFLVPSFHYISPKVGQVRYALSMVSPGGLSKRWSQQPAAALSEEFSLQTIELNPSVAYMLNDKFSLAAGLRMVYSSGVVKAQIPTVYLQKLEGDSLDFGYNLALAYKPTKEVEVGVTYRSNIDLTLDGDADIYHMALINPQRKVGVSVSVPLPASLNIALAYTIAEKTTVEFVYERNFWSSYNSLNFDFEDVVGEAVFGTPSLKDWSDVSAYRFGVTHQLEKYKLMAGIVFDNTPIPESTLGPELPDSDSTSVSVGMRYQVNEKLDFGISTLYSMRDDRKVNNSHLSGEFTDSNILLVSTGIGYKF
ncbi:OmpP1/FadL family transporter [Sulfurimonas sp.]|uniref:OmpP1/FadL family transporter n=1 Tax=Sulfurimonas sp. TaxID=2022749 RepID=UPI0035676186